MGPGPDTISYLDDTLTIANSYMECRESLDIIISTSQKAGFKVQRKKIAGPCKKIEFLGICIDTVAKQLSISRERITEIQHELHEWSGKQHASKRQNPGDSW